MIYLEQIPLEDDADEDVCHYAMEKRGRLILDTVHGQIILDVRYNDVNAYTFLGGQRVDFLLIPSKWRSR